MVVSSACNGYQYSGFDWLGEIPEDWQTIRAKYVLREINERSRTGDEELLSVSHLTGVTPRSGKNVNMFLAEDYTGAKLCQPNDVVVNTMWAWMGALGVSPMEGLVSPSYGVYRPNEKVFPKFLDSLLRTPQYIAEYIRRSTGIHSSRLRLYPNQFLDIPLLLPPLNEQKRIVEFIACKTSEIDQSIAQKQRLIELLEEQKAILINQAITKGINPNTPMRHSGIDWIGEIPQHWDIKKLKFIKSSRKYAFVDGPFGSNLKSEHYIENGDAYVVESGHITSGKFRAKDKFKTISLDHFHSISRSACEGGDIVIAKIGANYGMNGILPPLDKPAVVSGNSLKLTVNPQIASVEFIHYALLIAKMNGAFEDMVNTSAQPALSLGALNNLPTLFPPIHEQQLVVEKVKGIEFEYEAAFKTVQKEVEKLLELKSILIAEAVTGKFKV